MQTQFTRDELISICERGVVPVVDWGNRDTSSAQRQLGECYVLLKAGCDFRVYRGNGSVHKGNFDVLEVQMEFPGFQAFENGLEFMDEEAFYLPTPEDLERGGDWY